MLMYRDIWISTWIEIQIQKYREHPLHEGSEKPATFQPYIQRVSPNRSFKMLEINYEE